MTQIRTLTFGDRDAVCEVLQTRDKFWGSQQAAFDEQEQARLITKCRNRSNWQTKLWFGLFEDNVLDCWGCIKLFEHNGDKHVAHDMFVTRRKTLRSKYPNGYDVNLTLLYNHLCDTLEPQGYRTYWGVQPAGYKAQYLNSYCKLSRYTPQTVEVIAPGCRASHPIVLEHVYNNTRDMELTARVMTLQE